VLYLSASSSWLPLISFAFSLMPLFHPLSWGCTHHAKVVEPPKV
jgi:hypothetical protein